MQPVGGRTLTFVDPNRSPDRIDIGGAQTQSMWTEIPSEEPRLAAELYQLADEFPDLPDMPYWEDAYEQILAPQTAEISDTPRAEVPPQPSSWDLLSRPQECDAVSQARLKLANARFEPQDGAKCLRHAFNNLWSAWMELNPQPHGYPGGLIAPSSNEWDEPQELSKLDGVIAADGYEMEKVRLLPAQVSALMPVLARYLDAAVVYKGPTNVVWRGQTLESKHHTALVQVDGMHFELESLGAEESERRRFVPDLGQYFGQLQGGVWLAVRGDPNHPLARYLKPLRMEKFFRCCQALQPYLGAQPIAQLADYLAQRPQLDAGDISALVAEDFLKTHPEWGVAGAARQWLGPMPGEHRPKALQNWLDGLNVSSVVLWTGTDPMVMLASRGADGIWYAPKDADSGQDWRLLGDVLAGQEKLFHAVHDPQDAYDRYVFAQALIVYTPDPAVPATHVSADTSSGTQHDPICVDQPTNSALGATVTLRANDATFPGGEILVAALADPDVEATWVIQELRKRDSFSAMHKCLAALAPSLIAPLSYLIATWNRSADPRLRRAAEILALLLMLRGVSPSAKFRDDVLAAALRLRNRPGALPEHWRRTLLKAWQRYRQDPRTEAWVSEHFRPAKLLTAVPPQQLGELKDATFPGGEILVAALADPDVEATWVIRELRKRDSFSAMHECMAAVETRLIENLHRLVAIWIRSADPRLQRAAVILALLLMLRTSAPPAEDREAVFDALLRLRDRPGALPDKWREELPLAWTCSRWSQKPEPSAQKWVLDHFNPRRAAVQMQGSVSTARTDTADQPISKKPRLPDAGSSTAAANAGTTVRNTVPPEAATAANATDEQMLVAALNANGAETDALVLALRSQGSMRKMASYLKMRPDTVARAVAHLAVTWSRHEDPVRREAALLLALVFLTTGVEPDAGDRQGIYSLLQSLQTRRIVLPDDFRRELAAFMPH